MIMIEIIALIYLFISNCNYVSLFNNKSTSHLGKRRGIIIINIRFELFFKLSLTVFLKFVKINKIKSLYLKYSSNSQNTSHERLNVGLPERFLINKS